MRITTRPLELLMIAHKRLLKPCHLMVVAHCLEAIRRRINNPTTKQVFVTQGKIFIPREMKAVPMGKKRVPTGIKKI